MDVEWYRTGLGQITAAVSGVDESGRGACVTTRIDGEILLCPEDKTEGGGCTCRPVQVVRVIVENSFGKVLVLQRAFDSSEGGKWCLPGGKMDVGEAAGAAAKRELCEETQLEVGDLSFAFSRDGALCSCGALRYQHFYFSCSCDQDPVLNEESIGFAWVGLNDLPALEMAFGDDLALRQFVLR